MSSSGDRTVGPFISRIASAQVSMTTCMTARSRASRAPRNASCHVRAVRVLRVCVVVRVVCAGEGRDTREGGRGKKNQQPFDVLATTTTELKIS